MPQARRSLRREAVPQNESCTCRVARECANGRCFLLFVGHAEDHLWKGDLLRPRGLATGTGYDEEPPWDA